MAPKILINFPLVAVQIFCLIALVYGVRTYSAHANWSVLIISTSLAVGVLVGAVFFVGQEARKNVSLVIVSIAFAIFVFNFALETTDTRIRPINPLYDAVQAAEKAGISYDRRSLSEVVADLRDRGIDAYPNIGSRGLAKYPTADSDRSLFPIGGISNVVTVMCNESGKYAIYKSDRFGFNNDAAVYSRMEERVMLVGDSFTHGYCVDRSQNVATQLSKYGHNVVNIGIAGHGPVIELASLKEYGPYLRPAATVWLWWQGNDLEELAYEIKHPLLVKYVAERGFYQNLVGRQREIDALRKRQIGEIRRTPYSFEKYLDNDKELRANVLAYLKGIFTLHKVRTLFSLTREQYVYDLTASEKELFVHMRAILQEAKRLTASWQGKLYFVYIPSGGKTNAVVELERKELLAVVKDLGIPLIDFERIYRKHDARELHPLGITGVHFNEKGYALLAEQINGGLAKPQAKEYRQ